VRFTFVIVEIGDVYFELTTYLLRICLAISLNEEKYNSWFSPLKCRNMACLNSPGLVFVVFALVSAYVVVMFSVFSRVWGQTATTRPNYFLRCNSSLIVYLREQLVNLDSNSQN